MTRSSSRARQRLFRVKLTGFTMPTSGKDRKCLSIHEKLENVLKNWLCPNFSWCPKNLGPYTYEFRAGISDTEITFLDTYAYISKGRRLKKESILDVHTQLQTGRNFPIYILHLLPPSRRQERLFQRRSRLETFENQIFKNYI